MRAIQSLFYVTVVLILALLASYRNVLWESVASRSELRAWLPTWEEFVIDLNTVVPLPNGNHLGNETWRATFDAIPHCDFCLENWWLVFTVCASYLVMIPCLQTYMKARGKILATNCVVAWNLFLSVFSFAGMIVVVPQLLERLYKEGLESTVCSPATEYGHSYTGFFIFAFIMSKLFETVDTFWLLIRKSQILALQWYHHATVMLFCWHAYAVRTGYAGMWYAGMNYTVHTFMYLYFGAMMGGDRYRKLAKPFAMTITTMQILQMIMGMIVLMTSMFAQAQGRSCYNNKSNTILGLGMYFSYFVLFAKLFLEHYVFGGREKKEAARKKPSATDEKLGAAKEGNGAKISTRTGTPRSGNGGTQTNGNGAKEVNGVKEINAVKKS